MDQGIVGWVARHEQGVLYNDVAQDPRHSPQSGLQTCGVLAAPVVTRGEVVAVISVDGMEPDVFEDSDLTTLETIADQLAVAIENTRLYRQHQEKHRPEGHINVITRVPAEVE